MASTSITAQIISLSPEKPSFDEEVILTYDASRGNGELENFNQVIYIHTGLITNQSTSSFDWKNIVSEWNENKDELKMKKVGDNLYEFRFRINELYNIPTTGGNVAALAFIFRNKDGSIIGKEKGNQDIFYFYKKPSFKEIPKTLEVSQALEPDWAKKATIYEVNIRQYTQEGTFKAFAKHLPRLQKMGIDILWFMPIQPIGEQHRKGKLGSYYSIKDYTAINPEFGTMKDFKALIKKAKELGFKLVLDWVANHSAWDNIWAKKNPDWYKQDEDGNILAPYDWEDVADLDFNSIEMRREMIDAMKFWIKEIGLDGFRCDVAGEVEVGFWEEAREELDRIKPIWMLAENSDQYWLLNKAFNANYGWSFHAIMNKIAKGRENISAIFDYFDKIKANFPDGAYPMQFITNHDENSWAGTVRERLGEGHKAFAVLSFTVPGMPLIYSGQEVGLDKRLEFFKKDEIDWTDQSLVPFYTQLIKLKTENEALWNGNAGGEILKIALTESENIVAFVRTKNNNKVLTIINLSDQTQATRLKRKKHAGRYHEYFSKKNIILSPKKTLELKPWEYRVFIFENEVPIRMTTKQEVLSPENNIALEFFLDEEGTPYYNVKLRGKTIIENSNLGFDFEGQPSLDSGFKVLKFTTNSFDETWEMPWGEQRLVKNNYNEIVIHLQEEKNLQRKLNLYFRVYNDGIGLRYELLEQEGVEEVFITNENTEFQLTGDHTCWWIPGDWDIYEHLYNTTPFSEINALAKQHHPNLAQTHIPKNAVNTPITMRTKEGVHLSFHEANLTDYAGMTLKLDIDNFTMVSELVGSERTNYKVNRNLPFKTPWRTIQIVDKATELIDSKLILNLNEPNQLGNVDWFSPKKYVGVWWEMHLGVSTWDMSSGKHGATTENAKRYIDFAAKNNITGVLVEGWNTGWEHWIGFDDREGVFDFVTPYPDYDLEEVVRYAKSKGVEIIMHHETSAAPRTYEKQLEAAYGLMQRLGIHSVKTGYVGKIIPKGEYHHGQWMVNHYRKVLETAAKYYVAVNAHEPIKATGIRRTFPNAISREGLRGQEFNAWATDGGNPPEHLSIVAFTRMLGGPIDFTPGVFEIGLPQKENNQINTTLAHQLALYVVIYSPVQMACDLPENYEGHPAFQFIRDVGVDWENTKVLNGEVGDFISIARQERRTGNWFVGSITDENRREVEIDFNFLAKGKQYEAMIYHDALDAHWRDNPTAFSIKNIMVTHESKHKFMLAEGGGLAISIREKK